MNFDTAFDRSLDSEGGFQADPNDRGNWTTGIQGKGRLKGTKYGIAAMTYPDVDIKGLTVAEAKTIYRRDWWDRFNMDQFPSALQAQMFDAAINHGMHTATRLVQRAVGVKDDGIIGPVTRGAIAQTEINDLLMLFLAERLEFMTNLRTWSNFGRGWARRIAQKLKYAAEDTP